MGVHVRLREGGVGLARCVVEEDLVVAEVVAWVEHEVFSFLFVLQWYGDLTLENHVEFTEMLAFFYNLLICEENMAIQITHKVTYEFISSVCVLIFEYVQELWSELRE